MLETINYSDIVSSSKKFDKKLLRIQVKECHEEMIFLPQFFEEKKVTVVFSEENKTKKQFYLRKSVAEALTNAAQEFFNDDYILKIEDAYRSLETQKTKFLTEVAQVTDEFPNSSLRKLKRKVNTYVAGIPLLAAHTAGAAIDVTLIHKKTKEPVEFGASYLDLNETAVTDFPYIPEEAKENRRYFKTILEKHGLINYPFEFWHYSMGDVCAAYINDEPYAAYGPLHIDMDTGSIISFLPEEQLRSFFGEKKWKRIGSTFLGRR